MSRIRRARIGCIRLAIAAAFVVAATTAFAQAPSATPRVAPTPDVVFLDEQAVGPFVVQRWVDRGRQEVTPSGLCDCETLIYEGGRLVLDLPRDVASTVIDLANDITGDGRPELVVQGWSGGAHCCQSTAIYSVDDHVARPLLDINTGNCPGGLDDLDGDGVPEFRTCDDSFAYTFCDFASSPMPPVVYAYDRSERRFVLATPRFAATFPLDPMADLEKAMAEATDVKQARCAALTPALALIYTGREAQGLALFQRLYRRPDADAIEQQALTIAHASNKWVR